MSQIVVRDALPSEISDVSRLVFASYGERGYCSVACATETEQYFDQKISSYETLVVQKENRILGTMRITLDKGKLPVDQEFPDQMAVVRKQGSKVAYYSKFAVDQEYWGSKEIGIALILEAIRRWKQDAVDKAVMIVHPRHVHFYRLLGFKVVGDSVCAPGLEKAPAVMMVLEKFNFRDNHPILQNRFFASPKAQNA